jgi:hypothetical protein
VVVIVAGVVFEKGNAAPTGGLISIFTFVFTGTGVTLNAISICWFCTMESRLGPAPPSFAVKTVAEELAPWVRITRFEFGVEKATDNFVKSTGGAPGAIPIENLISVIVALSGESP